MSLSKRYFEQQAAVRTMEEVTMHVSVTERMER
jgi:hypothetical protein